MKNINVSSLKRIEMKSEILYHVGMFPKNEGANVENYIGFKHMTYLMEESIISFLRDLYLSPNILYKKYGIKIIIKSLSIDILKAMNVDDFIEIDICTSMAVNEFVIKAYDNNRNSFFRGKVGIDIELTNKNVRLEVLPEKVTDFLNGILEAKKEESFREKPIESNPISDLKMLYRAAFIYSKRIPYYYCNYTRELHHSGYERIIEEAVDLFLENKNLSIKSMLDKKSWIPVVSKSKLCLLNKVEIEDTIYVVFDVKNILFNRLYEADIIFFKVIDNKLLEVAHGEISHGYSDIKEPQNPELVVLDCETLKALKYEKA